MARALLSVIDIVGAQLFAGKHTLGAALPHSMPVYSRTSLYRTFLYTGKISRPQTVDKGDLYPVIFFVPVNFCCAFGDRYRGFLL